MPPPLPPHSLISSLSLSVPHTLAALANISLVDLGDWLFTPVAVRMGDKLVDGVNVHSLPIKAQINAIQLLVAESECLGSKRVQKWLDTYVSEAMPSCMVNCVSLVRWCWDGGELKLIDTPLEGSVRDIPDAPMVRTASPPPKKAKKESSELAQLQDFDVNSTQHVDMLCALDDYEIRRGMDIVLNKDDTALHKVLGAILQPNAAHKRVSIVLGCLVDRISSLKQSASRALLAVLLNACKIHGRATISLMNSVWQNKQFSNAQSEVLSRVLSAMSREMQATLIATLLSTPMPTLIDARIAVMNKAVNLGVPFSTLDGFVAACQRDADQLSNSVKFTALVFAMCNKCADVMRPHAALVKSVVDKGVTFMTRRAIISLDNISK